MIKFNAKKFYQKMFYNLLDATVQAVPVNNSEDIQNN